jgi:serine phosphatase RsbU (regulator of sigma subunit)
MTMEEGRLHVVEFRGYSTDFIDHFDGTPVTSDAPAARAFTTGAPAFFSSFAEYQGAYPGAPRHLDRNSWAFLPLTASSRHIGSLMLSYDQGRHFSPAERAVLTSLAGLIAQALDRARLFDAKHALARTLQTGLLPQRLPRVEGLEVAARYRSAGYGMDVGGDFYDLIHSDPAAAVAAIGDVQGHDPRAAALMGQIRTAVHAHATLGTSPDAIVAGTNGLVADLDQDLFASCLIVHADVTRHRARLSNAGHLPPLLRHPDGRTEVLRLPPGMLLGIDPHATYFTTEVPLPPGSVLALYTDGLVETPGTDIDDAIQDMALHLGRADGESMDDLADELVHHATGDTGRHDDIALLLLRPTS